MTGRGTAAGVIFQAEIGAYIAAGALADRPLSRLSAGIPGNAAKLLFETQAAVDDILVETENGIVFIQAKRTLPFSDTVGSELESVVTQFVRQFIAGATVASTTRRLSYTEDRLVLAVSDEVANTIKSDLREALDRYRTGAATGLPLAQKTALMKFHRLVKRVWQAQTGRRIPSSEKRELLRLSSVAVIGMAHRQLAEEALRDLVTAPGQEAGVLDQLIAWAADSSQRGVGGDNAAIRLALTARGAALRAPPSYQPDVDRLFSHTEETLVRLHRFSEIRAPEQTIQLTRSVVGAVVDAAREGNLAITGEPGAGKSAVLAAAARQLQEEAPVVVLAVEASFITLAALSEDIGLTASLPDLLRRIPGNRPAYLFLDALDAVRGGPAEAVYRRLVEITSAIPGWRVIASVRTFDLRLGREWRRIFRGVPPSLTYTDDAFAAVRHVHVPLFTDGEKEAVFLQSDRLRQAVSAGGSRLNDLVANPFNMALLSDLLKEGLAPEALSRITSRGDLLGLYWEERLSDMGIRATAGLRIVVDAMVRQRSIDIPETAVSMDAAETVTEICRLGVLKLESSGRLGFRHHILFDYAVARLLLSPDRQVALTHLQRQTGAGLLISPSLGYWLESLKRELLPSAYWSFLAQIIGNEEYDAIIRVECARVCVELIGPTENISPLAAIIRSDGSASLKLFEHLIGSLATKIEDGAQIELAPWVRLSSTVGVIGPEKSWPLKTLVEILVERTTNENEFSHLGQASRNLFDATIENENWIRGYSPLVIPLIAKTFRTDANASGIRLRKILEPSRFAQYGHIELPWLARSIIEIVQYDTILALECYYAAFQGGNFSRDQTTSMSESWILGLSSNAAQDFAMAAHELSRSFGAVIAASPETGTRAVARVLKGEQERDHQLEEPSAPVTITMLGQAYLFMEDHSHVWGWNIDEETHYDFAKIYRAFIEWVRAIDDEEILTKIPHWLLEESNLAIVWRTSLDVGCAQPERLGSDMIGTAIDRSILSSLDTRRSAIGLVQSAFPYLRPERRELVENELLSRDFSEFRRPEEAKTEILGTLFTAITPANLITDGARSFLARVTANGGSFENNRPVEFRVTAGPNRDWLEDEGVQTDTPNVSSLLALSEKLRSLFDELKDETLRADAITRLWDATAALDAGVETAGAVVTGALEEEVLDTLATGLGRSLQFGVVPEAHKEVAIRRLLQISQHADPIPREDTEASFARSPSWGSPSPRIAAARAIGRVATRAEFWSAVKDRLVELLFADPHPAVRFQLLGSVPWIGRISHEEMWGLIDRLLSSEANPTVLRRGVGELGALSGPDEVRLEPKLIELSKRFPKGETREDPITGLVVRYAIDRGYSRSAQELAGWVDDLSEAERVQQALFDTRDNILLGIGEADPSKDEVRRRTAAFFSAVVSRTELIVRSLASLNGPATEEQKKALSLFECVADQLFFATGHDTLAAPLATASARSAFIAEYSGLVKTLMLLGTPKAVYHLLEMLEHFVDDEPEACFDLLSEAMLRKTGIARYEFEHLGAQLFVRLVSLYLADYRHIFTDVFRRQRLVDCIALFVDAGWKEARKLFSRLPDLFK